MIAGALPLLIGQAPAAAASTAVAGVTVPAAQGTPGACPSVADGAGARTPDLACLNQQLKPVQDAPAPPDAAAATAAQGPNKVGLYDRAGTAQRLGPNFGHASAPPPRPVPVYPAFGGASGTTPK